jgi:hypothetical protein
MPFRLPDEIAHTIVDPRSDAAWHELREKLKNVRRECPLARRDRRLCSVSGGVRRFDEQKDGRPGQNMTADRISWTEARMTSGAPTAFGTTNAVYRPTNGNVRAAASSLAEVSPRTSKASGSHRIPWEPWLNAQLKGARDREPQGRRRIDLSECDRRQYQPCSHDDRRAAHEL